MQVTSTQITVPTYYLADDERTVYYQLQVSTPIRNWVLEKRYSQFEQLANQLAEYFPNMIPPLPKKKYTTFFTGKSANELEERRVGLQNFVAQLNEVVLKSCIFRQFIELPTEGSIQLQQQCEYLHGIRDFVRCGDKLYILNSEMNPLTRVDAYLQNMKLPWESEKGDVTVRPVGCLECWTGTHRDWVKTYNSQAICLYFSGNVLLVGLDSGSINYIRLSGNKYDQSYEIEQHLGRVMGLYYHNNLIHSVSKDQRYRVLDLSTEELIVDYEHKYELTCLRFCEERQCAFVGDRSGQIYIIKGGVPIVELCTQLQFIRDIYIDNRRNYLLAVGYESGMVIVFDIMCKGNECNTKEVTSFKNNRKSRCICWSASRGEVFIGNDEGYLTVWSAKDCSPLIQERIHNDAITRMQWDEEQHILTTASKDKTNKQFLMPKSWGVEMIEPNQQLQSLANWQD